MTPPSFDVRTKVHEYGCGAWLLQRPDRVLLQLRRPAPVPRSSRTPSPCRSPPRGRTATPTAAMTPRGDIVCVRETHGDADEPVNELVSVPAAAAASPEVIASGRDFYAFPRVRQGDGALCWLCWDHPNMPWDGCELWLDGRHVAGGPEESIWQPDWSPAGDLHWVSDRDGWWNLYTRRRAAHPREGRPRPSACGSSAGPPTPSSTDGTVACVRTERAVERLCLLREGRLSELDLPYTTFGFPFVRSRGDRLLFIAGAPDRGLELVTWSEADGERVLRPASDEPLPSGLVSVPRAIEFESAGGRTAHAFYYPPANPDFEGPPDERPPLLVQIHGGPTAHAAPDGPRPGDPVLDQPRLRRGRTSTTAAARASAASTASCCAAPGASSTSRTASPRRATWPPRARWTARGWPSTAAARAATRRWRARVPSRRLRGRRELLRRGRRRDPRQRHAQVRVALPRRADRALPRGGRELYGERSPIHFADRIRVPVLLLQGLEDEVVPPSQAEQMVAALKESGVPHAYLAFEGEQHGFRRAETIVSCARERAVVLRPGAGLRARRRHPGGDAVDEVKEGHRAMWGSGNYHAVAEKILAVGELLVERAGIRARQHRAGRGLRHRQRLAPGGPRRSSRDRARPLARPARHRPRARRRRHG